MAVVVRKIVTNFEWKATLIEENNAPNMKSQIEEV